MPNHKIILNFKFQDHQEHEILFTFFDPFCLYSCYKTLEQTHATQNKKKKNEKKKLKLFSKIKSNYNN